MKVLRVLQGVSYWVVEDPSEIAELMNMNLRKEWETDMAGREDRHGREWLESLRRRGWRLEKVRLDEVSLDDRIMDYEDDGTRYIFRQELQKRVRTLRDSLERFGAVIWPLVLRGEDDMLVDGYCRYHTLAQMGVTETLAYAGRLPGK